MDENLIASIIVDLCYKLHRSYGPGLMESVYEEVLCYELKALGLFVERQKTIPIVHKELVIPVAFRADLIVEKRVLIELKAVDEIPKLFYKKTLTYLRLTNLKLGLLINFNVPFIKEGIKRIVNNL
jgi:GxxExxY protein